jgi:hypothetical protein
VDHSRRRGFAGAIGGLRSASGASNTRKGKKTPRATLNLISLIPDVSMFAHCPNVRSRTPAGKTPFRPSRREAGFHSGADPITMVALSRIQAVIWGMSVDLDQRRLLVPHAF